MASITWSVLSNKGIGEYTTGGQGRIGQEPGAQRYPRAVRWLASCFE